MLWLYKDVKIYRISVLIWLILNSTIIVIGISLGWARLFKGLFHLWMNKEIGYLMYRYILLHEDDHVLNEKYDEESTNDSFQRM